MTIRTTLLSGLTVALSGLASAHSAVDQQNSANPAVRNIGTQTPTVSQSFTDQSGVINFVSFSLYVTSSRAAALANDTATYEVLLLQGNGPTGTLLAASGTQSLDFELDATKLVTNPVTFDFASPVNLDVGGVYTLELVPVTSTNPFKLGVGVSTGDQYAGGSWFNGTDPTKYNNTNGVDLIFAEGFVAPPTAVPEPANAALLMAGLGLVGLFARRRTTPN